MTGPRTLGEALDDAEKTLAGAGAWDPRRDAETLAAHVLGRPAADLPPGTALDPDARDRFQALVRRRAARTPLEYLTGRAFLGGIEIEVGPGVFVPRKHTEPLLAWGLDVLEGVRDPVVADLCAGSAAIALAVAHARPDAVVHAVELDPEALRWARRNMARRAAAGDTPIRLHEGDVTAPGLLSGLDGRLDLLLANPPFVVEGRVLPPEWEEHQPRPALFSGHDGLVVIRAITAAAARLLRPGGGVAIEHDDEQAPAVMALLAEQEVFTGIAFHTDHNDLPRYTTARRI
ncbi:N5-glutamine methyltransferase family protein [Bailinhaonella thermotolerans]|uniref:peptide chain release factor N(5)-glutamine methyltransferase n=1 Tax=Bailinhaonella thermotolerans TaxID=1070861 RepID=A0A3A4B0G0_9ACTN|nr:HemK/PrmC family methyltransferase [Bailinhaonella thermotolerans]RJL34339.1 peptide chain release factor N(5)-glutamine methyltransferase [Bailinhaonella thermotolerans]